MCVQYSPGMMSQVRQGIAVALVVFAAAAPPSVASSGNSPSKLPLPQQRLAAEVKKLRAEADHFEGESKGIGELIRLAPLITALVALIGVFLTLDRQRAETRRQRQLDRSERSAARQQRFDVQFQQIAENLGSEQGSTRAAAAAAIETFTAPEYEDFHERVFMLLLGALRFPRGDFGDKLMTRAFQRAVRVIRASPAPPSGRPELDLSNCALARVDLSGLDLSGADLAFADLHGANLSAARLWRARGYAVDLSGAHLQSCELGEARLVEATLARANLAAADLVSAKLVGAEASTVNFRGARLQDVHLERASLFGARFEDADLNNAYLREARFDEAALRSVARGARNWRRAHWDEPTRERLTELSAG